MNKIFVPAVVALVAFFNLFSVVSSDESRQPNIVFILADDLGYGDVQCLNPQRGKIATPHMDRLASQGMTFTDAHTTSSVCTPTRYGVLTGRYNWRTKLQKGVLWGYSTPLIAKDRTTVAGLLNQNGYRTACFGKWHLGMDMPTTGGTPPKDRKPKTVNIDWKGTIQNGPTAVGFDTFYGISASLDMAPYIYISDDQFVGECEGGKGKSADVREPDFDTQDVLPEIGRKAAEYISNHDGEQPFFVYVPLTSPHTPIVPSSEWIGKSVIGKYGDFVMQTDHVIGQIVDAVDAAGLSENTIVIVTSDNGCSRAAKISDMQAKGHYPSAHLRGSKADLWDGGHRVPFFVRWPNAVEAGSQCDQTICQTDLMATCAELAGTTIPDRAGEDSVSFLPALSGKPIVSSRKGVIHHSISGCFAYRQGKWKLLLARGSGGWTAPGEGAAKKAGAPVAQLYDMENDPGETTNLYASHPEEVERLLAQLETNVMRGRSTDGPESKNDVDFIKLWKSGKDAPETKRYDGTWESLQQMPVPAWFDEGKIGIFIHWGPYSAIGYRKGGGYAEHVPKLFYADPETYYPYMEKRWGANPPEFGYKDIIPEFTASNWDPDEWATLFSKVGAKYVVLTAEHHDGWANWDSDLTPWNAVDKGPHRDLVGDLAKAVRKQGLKYAPSYHRERHTGFFAKEKYMVHSEPRPDIVEEIKRVPEAAMLYGPEFSYNKAFVDDYVARWKEIQTKYRPDMLWLDDFPIYTRDGNKVRAGKAKPEIKYLDDQMRGMITDFMNDGAARGQEVYCNNKGGNRNWPDGVGCLEKDNLKLKVIGPKWQSCTTFGSSFGYKEGDKYKAVKDVIHEMIEVISRNGNFLINIGPREDGTIPEPQVDRLEAMGDWLKINGDAIYGTRYWKQNAQEDEQLAFTTKG